MTNASAMEKDKPRPNVRRPDVLRKFNAESLLILERGLGELPEKLRPKLLVPVRGNSTAVVARQPSFLSSCLPVIPQSPAAGTPTSVPSSEDESVSPLRKTFSFRDRLSRMSFFHKDKEKMEKPKWASIAENENNNDKLVHHGRSSPKSGQKMVHDQKTSKRFWFFRNKEIHETKRHSPVYVRSKSFEFLPKAAEEIEEERKPEKSKRTLKHSLSYVFTSSESLDTLSNESSEYPSNVYYDNDDGVFLKSVKEFASESSPNTSSMSVVTSASSGIVVNMFKTQSVQDIMNEFNKAIEMFSESYLSDSEPYTKSGVDQLPVSEKRKSFSYSTLPSPKVMQVNKVNDISEDFKSELNRALSVKRASGANMKTSRRGSVTDWFVLEDKAATAAAHEQNKYRRAQKKPVNRVRRISSTKYWITPEECAVYSREQRPPLVIPRITQYRAPRRETKHPHSYQEDTIQEPASVKSSVRQYERLQDWSPTSERSRADLDRSFSKANSDSPPFVRINKRLGNSTENLLFPTPRRPNHLQLPASSSGDSLDVEIRDRDREPGYTKSRKSRSMVAPKHRMRSPVPAPRMLLHQPSEAPVILEGPVKRTKFSESGKKSKKNWNDCYMVLTPTALIFFKDQKTYYATRAPRPPGTPPSPTAPRAELVLPLRNAHVVHCIQMHTRRFTKSMVLTVGYDQYLLQDDCEEGAKRWLINIQNVIYKLGPPMPEEFHSPNYLSSNTDVESLGRTPPAARHARNKHKAGGSSNEDLSDSTEASIQKSHVRSILRKFFPKRPAMEVLVKKGIYQDEPVFGRKLDEVCPVGPPRVPEFVVACVKEIESSDENMSTDGLYRASGNLSQVQKIRLEIDQNNLSVIESNTDIHVLTGSLKLFFRELKEPLIPCNLFDRILSACSIKPRDAKIKEFRDIVQSLPQCNRDTLKYLLEHLLRVTQYSERNRMHTANLAIVFGPTLLWAPAEQAHNIAIDCIQQNNVVDILLNDFKDIFTDDNPKGKKKA